MRLIFKAFTHKTRNVPPEAIDLRTPEDNNGLEPSLGCRLLFFCFHVWWLSKTSDNPGSGGCRPVLRPKSSKWSLQAALLRPRAAKVPRVLMLLPTLDHLAASPSHWGVCWSISRTCAPPCWITSSPTSKATLIPGCCWFLRGSRDRYQLAWDGILVYFVCQCFWVEMCSCWPFVFDEFASGFGSSPPQ